MSKRGNTEEWAEYVRELGDLIKEIREMRSMSQERVAFASGDACQFLHRGDERQIFNPSG